MFNLFSTNPAVALLKDDHDRVKALFDRFETARGRAVKMRVVRQALAELKVHAAIEEELFYPSVRKSVGKEVMNEAEPVIRAALPAPWRFCPEQAPATMTRNPRSSPEVGGHRRWAADKRPFSRAARPRPEARSIFSSRNRIQSPAGPCPG